jgi:uncharacterized membrane protein YedE/YeeE
MHSTALSALTVQVLWAGFLVSMVFGAITQRTRFCTMGAISDVVSYGDWTRMRQWGMAVGVATIGFSILAYGGWINPSKSIYASTRWLWLSALVGGFLFGLGMVLGSGCGSKTLVRIGSGNLKAFVVFLVMGVAAFATLKGITAVLRVATVERVGIELSQGSTLTDWAASALGVPATAAGIALSMVIGGGLIFWASRERSFRHPENYIAGVGIGGAVIAMWWVSGNLGHVVEHPETLQEAYLATNSGRMEALSFTAPMAYALDWIILFSDRSKVLTLAVVSVLGVIAGSAVQAVVSGDFRWEGFGGTEDLANHLIGAMLMGIGGVTAMGCTVGQGLSGISTLSASSFLAVAGIMLGAVMALRYQNWRLERAV